MNAKLNRFSIVYILTLSVAVLFTGCFRGTPSTKPPIHINPNMDLQPKYKAQSESAFFADNSSMRVPVAGTVARGELRENTPYYTGKDDSGNLIPKIPIPVTKELVLRGQERYDIYCTPCHSKVGDAKSIIVEYNFIPPPLSFHDDRLRTIEDGHLFDVITNGIRNMQSYKAQISVSDRWAIVSYVRALQRSQNAKMEDVPASERSKIGN